MFTEIWLHVQQVSLIKYFREIIWYFGVILPIYQNWTSADVSLYVWIISDVTPKDVLHR